MNKTVYHRFFRVTEGELLDEVRRLMDQREEARKAIVALSRELGCEIKAYESGGIAGFAFKKKPDQEIWKQPNRYGLYWPRKNTAAGKEMWARIKQLPEFPGVNGALRVAGLNVGFPCLIAGRTGYSPVLWGYPAKGVIFVKVPWRDEDPERLATYQRDKTDGICFSADLDHLLWVPPAYMQEIKEWQALKEYEELSATEAGHA